MTGVPQWVAASSSQETGEAGEVGGWLCTLGRLSTPWSWRSMTKRSSTMGKNQGKASKADILVGVSYRPANQNEEIIL